MSRKRFSHEYRTKFYITRCENADFRTRSVRKTAFTHTEWYKRYFRKSKNSDSNMAHLWKYQNTWKISNLYRYENIHWFNVAYTRNLLAIVANPCGPIMLRRNHCRLIRCKILPQAKCRNHRRKICKSMTDEDDLVNYLVKLSGCYTKYFIRNRYAIFEPSPLPKVLHRYII